MGRFSNVQPAGGGGPDAPGGIISGPETPAVTGGGMSGTAGSSIGGGSSETPFVSSSKVGTFAIEIISAADKVPEYGPCYPVPFGFVVLAVARPENSAVYWISTDGPSQAQFGPGRIPMIASSTPVRLSITNLRQICGSGKKGEGVTLLVTRG